MRPVDWTGPRSSWESFFLCRPVSRNVMTTSTVNDLHQCQVRSRLDKHFALSRVSDSRSTTCRQCMMVMACVRQSQATKCMSIIIRGYVVSRPGSKDINDRVQCRNELTTVSSHDVRDRLTRRLSRCDQGAARPKSSLAAALSQSAAINQWASSLIGNMLRGNTGLFQSLRRCHIRA